MRIVSMDESELSSDNGACISVEHRQHGCECNYADFSQLDELARSAEFTEPLVFEKTDFGFRFGNKPINMHFVPCYSVQNGYYSSEVEVYYRSSLTSAFNKVLEHVECDVRVFW